MSRYLIDENLPITLAPIIGGECTIASSLGARPTDAQLWQHARADDRVLLTKDADFFERILLEGPPPKIVWLRVGNLRRVELEAHVRRVWPAVLALLATCDVVQVHRDQLEGLSLQPDSAE